jgi:hypothetical protein
MIIRGEDKQEEPMRLTYFDDRLFSTRHRPPRSCSASSTAWASW